MTFLVSAICILNVILWIVFLVKFRKLFSSEKIIEQTRSEMEKLLSDMNRNTERNVKLVNAASDRLKQLIAESEQKNEQLNKKLAAINSDISTQESAKKLSSTIRQAAVKKESAIKPTDKYELAKDTQKELFDSPELEIKDEVTITNEGAAYREVPIISAPVYKEPPNVFPAKNKKTLNQKVMEFSEKGLTVEEIASKLSVSTTEVQLIIDLGNLEE